MNFTRSAFAKPATKRSCVAAACVLAGLLVGALPSVHAATGIDATNPPLALKQILDTLRKAPAKGSETEALTRASAALRLAADLDLQQASKAINEALQLDARNSYLHFFNGFIYHLMAHQGDTAKTDLAIEGYRQAARFEPGNWIANEFLGLALVEQKQYDRAQNAFADVLMVRPDDPVVLSRMLATSYMAGDSRTACAMADQIRALPRASDAASRAEAASFLRTAVSVYAACGEFSKAEASRSAFERSSGDPSQTEKVGRRLEQWKSFFKSRSGYEASAGAMVKTQFAPGGSPAQGFDAAAAPANQSGFAPGAAGGTAAGAPAGAVTNPDGTRMVLVDVVMVRTEDSISTSQGVNLLSALSLQFGSSSAPAFSQIQTSGSTILTRAITVPALAYSLNLANANSNLNEVLARPTLAAVEGSRSEFFSGTSLNAAVVSSGSVGAGSAVSVEKRYGVKLSVLPQILPSGMIRLVVDASRTFLKPPSANIGFTYKLEISEILANANVVMRMGDTLVLGGLSEKESTTNRDGVPVLQDAPLLQYIFSQKTKTDYQRSVLILITPRPAAYTWLSEESKAAQENRDGSSAGIDVLRARYSDWFKPYPNLASVFHHLNYADLYREFRTGDVTLERWDRMDSTRERLNQALDFLYY